MKKAIFLFCFFAFGFNAFAYWPIVSVFRSDRDLFGYREVSHQLVSLPDGGFGWETDDKDDGVLKLFRMDFN